VARIAAGVRAAIFARTWKIVPGSDHLIASSQPHAVAAEVLKMISDAQRLHENVTLH